MIKSVSRQRIRSYVSLDVEGYILQRYMQQHEEVELSALGMGM
jgi:hypothetical protein